MFEKFVLSITADPWVAAAAVTAVVATVLVLSSEHRTGNAVRIINAIRV